MCRKHKVDEAHGSCRLYRMKLGYKKSLMEDDLWALRKSDQADALGNRFSDHWENQREKCRGTNKTPSVWLTLIAAYGGPFFVAAVFKACLHSIMYSDIADVGSLSGCTRLSRLFAAAAPSRMYTALALAI